MYRLWCFAICIQLGLDGISSAYAGPNGEYLPAGSAQIDSRFDYQSGEEGGTFYLSVKMPGSYATARIRCNLRFGKYSAFKMDRRISNTGITPYVFGKLHVPMKHVLGKMKINHFLYYDAHCKMGQIVGATHLTANIVGVPPSVFVQSVEQNEKGNIQSLTLGTAGRPLLNHPNPRIGGSEISAINKDHSFYTCAIYSEGGLVSIAEAHREYEGDVPGKLKIKFDRAIVRFDGMQCQHGGFDIN
ncbi:hypothetical protein MKK68_10055 [Methylobacterium sp. E-016]|uniref:hypothetical protein n=1 Tax=Methylobacterium sp. E-016 TaxID=2836556 RepID=UPI001FBAECC8|nr:hypothetical protein [Methylobacterium sp. E-016]MCJ2075996.1 hypothetical protein [Methylobacterium sp. E-016]